MAIFSDRVQETTTTTGTGSIALAGAVAGFQSFNSGFSSGNTPYYAIVGQGTTEWEVGLGTFTSPSTLARTTVLASSNAGAAVVFSAGTKNVWSDVPASVLALILSAVQTSRQVASGDGLTGGGDMSADRTLKINAAPSTIASATTTNLGSVTTINVVISGTTTITGFGTGASLFRVGTFSDALTLTHNATSLILPGAANITTVAGDRFVAVSDASGNWTVIDYVRASGKALIHSTISTTGLLTGGGDIGSNRTFDVPKSSNAQAIAGTDDATAMTPLRTADAIAALGGGAISQQSFTASNTWTKPAKGTIALIECFGAGGSGGRQSSGAGCGGGGGGYNSRWVLLSSLGATETVTIGSGGAARSGTNQNGAAGGNTTFGSWLTGFGGGGGGQVGTGFGGGGGGPQGAGGTNVGAAGGAPRSSLNAASSYGDGGTTGGEAGCDGHFHGGGGGGAVAGGGGGVGGKSVYGGGGGGGGGQSSSAGGGVSLFGGNGGAGATSTTATAGAQPGGGGGGTSSGTSGAGGAGKCVVTVY